MGAGKRWLKFAGGGLVGAGVGSVIAALLAPRSGEELKGKIADRLRETKIAGTEAKAAKEAELIQKFRAGVGDPGALQDKESQIRHERAETVAAVGLGLNAPGALAAQETALRTGPATVPTEASKVRE
jgi:gas vesicle protein